VENHSLRELQWGTLLVIFVIFDEVGDLGPILLDFLD
jgi:hypothetical protein